jgi:hypothetical protein
MGDDTLRVKASELLVGQQLPGRRPERMWGQAGVATSCSLCGAPAERAELEFQLQFTSNREDLGPSYMHSRCFAAWEFARQAFRASRAVALSGAALPCKVGESIMPRHERDDRVG